MMLIRMVSSVLRNSKFFSTTRRRGGRTQKQVETDFTHPTVTIVISGELALKKTGSTKSLSAAKETKQDPTLEDLREPVSRLTLSRRSPQSCRKLDPADGRSSPSSQTLFGTKSRRSVTSRSLKHK